MKASEFIMKAAGGDVDLTATSDIDVLCRI